MSKTFQHPLVLMYHGIVSEWTALPKTREVGADLYDVNILSFQEQMEFLKANQYTVGLFKEETAELDQPEIVLTFDDGEMNNYERALPVLKKCGFPAYFFVIAKRVGEWGYMGWGELKAMHQAGMVIGSHGFSHEILTNLLDSQIEEELRASKRYLENNLGITVDAFSVPRGFCDNKIVRMAYEAGYKYVFISDRPWALNFDCFSRLAVKANWTLARFEQAVEGMMPSHERVLRKCKSAVKRILGEGVYDWVRKAVLKI